MFDDLEFDWDAGNRLKCQKHGVSIAEIEALFLTDPLVSPDILHSIDEDRLVAVGRAGQSPRLFVIFTFRDRAGQRLIRPVSARYMRKKEFLRYVKGGT